MTTMVGESPSETDRLLQLASENIPQGLTPVEIFANGELFDEELKRIFARNWVFVAFESELPESGDFVTRSIGKDPVLVTRDRTGQINVLANFCRHRGAQLCAQEQGNALNFRCPYHGWVYRNNGAWRGAPGMAQYYKGLKTDDWGLLKAPHVASLYGMIFACLAPEAPSLEAYLGGGGWMLKMIMDLHPQGMTVMGPPDRYRVRGNWKTASENFAGDTYHLNVAHRSVQTIQMAEGFEFINDTTVTYISGNGHCFTGSEAATSPTWGYGRNILDQLDLSRLDDVQRETVLANPPTVGNIFPNLGFIRFGDPGGDGREPMIYTSFRQFQPISPTETEILSWQLKWTFEADATAEAAYAIGQYGFGSSGIFEQDDAVLWEGPPKAADSHWARSVGTLFNMQLGMEKLEGKDLRDADWHGPGERYKGGPSEAATRSFYARWLSDMAHGN